MSETISNFFDIVLNIVLFHCCVSKNAAKIINK